MAKPRGFWQRPIPELAQDWTGKHKAAGCGYITIQREGTQLLHRLVWEHYHGPIPEGMCIDHINGNPLDDRLENLRCVSERTNHRNQKMHKRNTSGVTGVVFKRNRSGTLYWRATWCDTSGRLCERYFNIGKLGDAEAKRQATEYRAARIAEIGGYTERHGT